MRRLQVVVMILMLAALTLAGCTGKKDAADTSGNDPVEVTDPRDFSYDPESPGGHVHNYWGGRQTLLVVDQPVEGSFSATCGGCTNGMALTTRRSEPDHVVPAGTAWVNVTFSWEENPDSTSYGSMELWLKTAADDEPKRVGAVENGKPFTFNSTNEQNDPPHQILSLWQYRLVAQAPEGSDEVRFSGKIGLVVTAARGLPIPAWPAHPDHWQGATEIELLQESGSILLQYEVEYPMGGRSTSCYGGCLGRYVPADGKVVPIETDRVEVEITYPPGTVPTLGLLYHGADSWDYSEATLQSSEPGRLLFVIESDAVGADSPYALQSLWDFRVYLDQPTPLRAFTGEYTVTATAHKAM